MQCDRCNLLYTNPRPHLKDIGSFYESQDYISHHNTSKSISDVLYKMVRSYTLRSKVSLVRKYQNTGSLLDIGCGTGFFLNKAAKNGLNSYGVEPNKTARDLARTTGITVQKDFDDYKDHTFDIITMWHVLEHVYDLNSFLIKLNRALNTNGTIFIAVPNSDSYDAKHYGKHWAAYDLPRHLYHFNQHTFRSTIDAHKMKIVSTIPMKFDAFYVSLLSEKYIRPSSTNYITFLINGIKSNRFANKNNNNYSSLIYVIKKA
ncbi:MAG: class I SAM-dependent methyltransferase [Bacteroidota bacterium]